MSPLFFALLITLGIVSVLSIFIVHLLDVNDRLRHLGKPLPTINQLPRCVAIPTSWRKDRWT